MNNNFEIDLELSDKLKRENGDSIYTSTSREVEQKGKEYVIIEIVSKKLDRILDQVGLLQKAMALLRVDLVKAGVLKAA